MTCNPKNIFENLMALVTVTKVLCDDVLKNWADYTPEKQYSYGLLGKMLIEKITEIMEIHRGVYCEDTMYTTDKLKKLNVPLVREQSGIITLMDMTEWRPGLDEDWMETNDIELCRDIILVAGGCIYFIAAANIRICNETKKRLGTVGIYIRDKNND